MTTRRDRRLERTPALERLLARLRARLTANVCLHGVGLVLGAASLWIFFAFFADWALHVPATVRWIHCAVALALPAVVAARELVRHLRRVPDRAGLALLIERADPGLRELYVSAVQLQTAREPDGDPELIERVLRDADARAARASLDGVLDPRAPRWRFTAGAASALLLALIALSNRELASIFAARLAGSDVAWPKRTDLDIEIAAAAPHVLVERDGATLRARVTRGSEIPLVVRARGVVPAEVLLHFGSGAEVALAAGSDGQFRTLLPPAREAFELYATGGDDHDREPTLRVAVADPPDVAALAVAIEPPEYTGAPARLERDRDVAVLAGSRMRISIAPEPNDARGEVRLLPESRTIALEPSAFPARDGAARPGLAFSLVPARSLRYRFELVDSTGLADPDPGLFSIDVVPDRRPDIELIAPARTDVETTVAGSLRLRVRAEDDFGLRSLAWRLAGDASIGAELERVPLVEASPGRATCEVAGTRIDVASLVPAGTELAAGQAYEIEVVAADNRPPNAAGAPDPAGVATAARIRVRVVTEEEFLRRLQDRLARLRLQATALEELQRQKLARSRELVASLESDQPAVGTSESEIGSVLTGERRVLGDSESLTREFAAAVEGLLYARLDEQASAVLGELDLRLASANAKGFQADAWAEILGRWRSGELSAGGLTGALLSMFDLALGVSRGDAPAACADLESALRAVDLPAVHAHLTRAVAGEERASEKLAQLVDRLAEWDNFQSILSLTRDILSRQKSLRDRTRGLAGDKR
jgi:hypothetical protein